MLVGEYMPVGAVIPTLPLYASLDQPAKPKQRTFAAQTLKTNIQFQGVPMGLPPGLPGARYYPGMGQYKFDPYQSRKYRYSGLGQQVTPRGFGQQMSASGRVAGKGRGRNAGMFGLGQYRYAGLGQQVSPRGFGQQMSASGRVAGKSGRNGGMFGLHGLGLPMVPGAEGATTESGNDLFGVDDSLF